MKKLESEGKKNTSHIWEAKLKSMSYLTLSKRYETIYYPYLVIADKIRDNTVCALLLEYQNYFINKKDSS